MNRFLAAPEALDRPWFDSPLFEHHLRALELAPDREALVRRYREDGYLVLEECIEPELIDRILARYDWLFDPETRFEAAPHIVASLELFTNRRQDAWGVCDAVRELAGHPKVLDVLRLLYRREPIPFQTLNFREGTEQSMHADSFHFSCLPAGFLCGVWVALEDITVEQGPLRYAKGSHRFSEVQLADLRLWKDRTGPEPGPNYAAYEEYVRALMDVLDPPIERLVCPKGTALIWAADLLHGGSPIERPGSTRFSQVTHYYFEDCVYYSPLLSDTVLGEYWLRTVHDARTGAHVPHCLNGTRIRADDAGYPGSNLFHIRRPNEELGGVAPDPFDAYRTRIATLEAQIAEHSKELDSHRHLAEELERERSALSTELERLRTERQRLTQDLQGFQEERDTLVAHAADLESQLARIHTTPSYRILGAIKRRLRPPDRNGTPNA